MTTADDVRQFVHDPLAFFDFVIINTANGRARFGDVMADFQRERFAALAPALAAVAEGRKPEIGKHLWEGTKGSSKDSDLAIAVIWLLVFSPRPLLIQVGAADREQADELRKAAAGWLRNNSWLGKRIEIQANRILCEKSGAVCEIIPADTAGSHGARPDVLILNELSHIRQQEFAENLMDNAAKVPNNLTIIATNAGDVNHFSFKWRELYRTSPRCSFHQFTQTAPWLDPADVEDARARNSIARFNRLWQGVWSTGSGDALDATDIDAAINANLSNHLVLPDCYYIAGLDLGLRSDATAFVVLGFNVELQAIYLAGISAWRPTPEKKVSIEEVEKEILYRNRYYNGFAEVSIDPWNAESTIERLRKEGVPVFVHDPSAANKHDAAMAILTLFRERRIEIFPDADLLKDLRACSIVERSSKLKLELVHDERGHCDRLEAMSLAAARASTALEHYVPPNARGPARPQYICDNSSLSDSEFSRYGF